MTRRPDLPKPTAETLDSLLRQAGEATRADDLRRSFALGQQAWDALPEPRTGWDFYPQIIARNMVDKAVALHDRARVEAWLRLTYKAYDDPGHDNHFVNMLEGKSWRALSEDEAAYAAFDKIYVRDGRAGFKGEHLAHLEWYLKEKARRRG